MEMEKFRSGREEVERIIRGIEEEIKAKFVLKPDKKIEKVQQIIDGLTTEASGDIQIRSVSNMNNKINVIKGKIEKLPVKKKPAKKRTKKK